MPTSLVRDSQCLRKLVCQQVITQWIILQFVDNYVKKYHLTSEMVVEARIGLVDSSWNEYALNLVGELFLLERLHPQWMSLHTCREPQAHFFDLGPHQSYRRCNTSIIVQHVFDPKLALKTPNQSRETQLRPQTYWGSCLGQVPCILVRGWGPN